MSVLRKMRKRIAIYGGTFDPVHSGHLEIARRVTQLFGIDEFLFVPAMVAPHKQDREVSPALHRYAMLALATRADPQLSISTFELDGPGRRYTVDTLFHFRARFGVSADLFFVMGADSWAEITSWREWRRLLTLANLIVVTRPGYEISAAPATAEIAANVLDLRGAAKVGASEPGTQKVFVTDAVLLDVSATEIRRAANEDDGEKLNKLVPLEVAEYIRKYRLYRNTTDV
ncbi:MAG: nicotinate-nucleotide adenylyltransferase [Pyrinomonadaceae bacterium]